MHLSYEQLKSYQQQQNDPEVQSHLRNCSICSNVLAGIQMTEELAKAQGVSPAELLSSSRERVRRKLQQPASSVYKKYLAIAASVVIAVSLGLYLFISNSSAKTEGLMAMAQQEYYRAPDVLRSSQTEDVWVSFNKYYASGDFDNALQALPEHKEAVHSFYEGLCLIYKQTPDYDRAISIFRQLSSNNNRFREQATWYLSVAYYHQGMLEESIEIWKQIANQPGHYQSDKAMKLLSELE